MLDAVGKDIWIQGMSRGAGGIEIAYFEKREQSDNVGIARTLILSDAVDKYNDRIEEIMDVLEELIDLALIDLRNPAPVLGPAERRAARRAAREEAEDDD